MPDFDGTDGDDIFTGSTGQDKAKGGSGYDKLYGGDELDILAGGTGADLLYGGNGNDVLYSADLSPTFDLPFYTVAVSPAVLDSGTEIDTLYGGNGDDYILAGYGDKIDGGANDYRGDSLYISFIGATSGMNLDFTTINQTIGQVSISNIENVVWIQGTNYNDTITPASNSSYSDYDMIEGMGGDDHIFAGRKTGTIWGGDGNDVLDGRTGDYYLSKIDGGAGDDVIYTLNHRSTSVYGGDGNDTLYSAAETHGGSGDDLIIMDLNYYIPGYYLSGVIYGDDGNDEIRAAASGNALSGGSGADTLIGSDANDTLWSAAYVYVDPYGYNAVIPTNDDVGAEHDRLSGGGGDDTLLAGFGDDIDGGTGTDTLRLSLAGAGTGVVFDTTGIVAGTPTSVGGGTIQNVESLTFLQGSAFADQLTLATQSNRLFVDGGAGSDVIAWGDSSVDVRGGDGDDLLINGAAGDTIDGGAGNDIVDFRNNASAVTLALGDPGATIKGPGGDTILNVEGLAGSAFADTLTGNALDNVLDGGSGDDLLSGGIGNDRYIVDSLGDRVVEAVGGGYDTLLSKAAAYVIASGAEIEFLSTWDWPSTITQDLTGNAFGQAVYGNAGINHLFALGGDDRVFGQGGDDVLDGGTGNDLLDGGAGIDVASYAAATAAVHLDLRLSGPQDAGSAGIDTFVSIEGLTGSAFDDVLIGSAGSNLLDGGAGDDATAYAGLYRSYALAMLGGAGTVGGGAEGGTDTLTSIETLIFKDGYLTTNANSDAAEIMRLYDTVLHRAPDGAGLDYWIGLMNHGATYGVVAAGFLGSPEFQAATGGLSDSAYIDFLYTSALGRPADSGGKAYWLDQLAHGSTRADLLGGFSESPEHRGLTAGTLANGLFVTDASYKTVAALYDTFAGREPDAAGGPNSSNPARSA